MLNLKSIHGHHKIILTLLVALTSINFIEAVDTNNGTTPSCTPLNCVASCTHNCNINEVCILRTMTNCAICPASNCMSRTVLGLPPVATSSTAPDQSASSGNGVMIGGIVGGLVGLGIIVGVGVYCYIKRGKKRGKLPFAFTNGAGNPSHIMSQEKFMSPPPTPNLAIVAALSPPQQQQSCTSVAQQQPSRYIGLAELGSITPTSTIASTQQRSILSTTPTLTSTIASTQQRSILSPTNTNSIPSPHRFNSINTPLYINNDNNTYNDNFTVPTPTSTIITTPTTAPSYATIPEEFEERIAIQNKRISQILNSNPRLSQQHRGSFSQPPPLPQQQQNYDTNINSYMSYTTDDDSEFDDDDRNSMASSNRPQVARQQYQPQLATQAGRAKVQIMRVNSVRASVTGGSSNGLSRSESVRTILTAVTPPIPQQDSPPDDDEELADQFPSTPNNHSFATIEDPFLDINTSSKSVTSDEYWGHK